MNRETRKLVRRMKSHRLVRATIPTIAATIRPARISGSEKARTRIQMAPIMTIVRHASPNSNLRLKSMLLHSPIKRAPAQAELGRGQRHVEMVHPQRPLDHLLFELVKV